MNANAMELDTYQPIEHEVGGVIRTRFRLGEAVSVLGESGQIVSRGHTVRGIATQTADGAVVKVVYLLSDGQCVDGSELARAAVPVGAKP